LIIVLCALCVLCGKRLKELVKRLRTVNQG
jgi:hypothetical protein